jgi:phosphoglycolate phosphatase
MARVIFDLDGTLVDSAPTIAAAANALVAELGRAVLPIETVLGFVGHGMERLVSRVLAATGGVPAEGVGPHLARYRGLYEADPLTGTAVYGGVQGALAELAAAGHGLGVCTQKPAVPSRAILTGFGLMPPIAALTGGDSIAVLKPDPAMLAHTARQLSGGPVIFVGDSETDAATAANAGVPFVLHLPGYRHGPLEAIARAAEFEDYADLPGIVADLLEELG